MSESLPDITICDCVTERAGVPHVCLPLAQYKALMAAAEVLSFYANTDNWKQEGFLGSEIEIDGGDLAFGVIAALRAAGPGTAVGAPRELEQENERLAAQIIEAEKYNGWHQQALLRIRQLETERDSLKLGIKAQRDAREEAKQEFVTTIRELEAERDSHFNAYSLMRDRAAEIAKERDDYKERARMCLDLQEVAEAERDAIRRKTDALLGKLDAIEANESFQGIWPYLHVHGYTYTGPNWKDEVAAIRALAQADETETEK